jgi:cytochrome P450
MQTIEELFGGDAIRGVADPHPVYRRLRQEAPVLRLDGGPHETYLVTRYDDVHSILKDHQRFSNHSNASGISLVMGRTIIEMDGREHIVHRNLVSPSFKPSALRGEFPKTVAEIAHGMLDEFADAGRADLVPAFTYTYPLRVFNRILGLPVEDYDTFHNWAIDLTEVGTDPARGLAASKQIADYLRPILEERRRAPTQDLFGELLQAEIDRERLSDEEIVSFVRLLVIAGAETTFHLMGSALYAVLHERRYLDALYARRDALDPILHEALRWESPIQWVTREVAEKTLLRDVAVPAGAHLLLAIGSANRDERHFHEPDRFDPERKSKSPHIAFGYGRHFCVGSRLANVEAKIGLEALLDRLPDLRLDPDAEHEARIMGLAFRGPDHLPVRFGPA